MQFNITANYKFTSKISWVHSAGSNRGYFDNNLQLTNSNPTVYNLKARSDSTTNLLITAFTEAEGVCPFAQDFMNITINPKPHGIIAVDDPDGCVPHKANFTSSINNGVDPSKSNFTWKFGDGDSSKNQNPTHTYLKAATNTVTLKIVSDKGCDTILGPMIVDVYPIPVADFVPNPNNSTTAALPRFRFTDQSSIILKNKITNHTWDFGDLQINTDTSTQLNPEYYYTSDTGTYYVTLIVESEHGCKDTIVKPVIIGPDILVYIPNVFSPDGAGPLKNDKFWVEASGYETYQILIFNRWGEKLYESHKLDEPWDGKYKGELVQMDAYVFEVQVTSFSKKLYKYSGTVILVR